MLNEQHAEGTVERGDGTMDETKLEGLKRVIGRYKRVVVAFSGGVDSSLVLKSSADTLGGSNVVAVTGTSETYTRNELEEAKKIARRFGVEHVVTETAELSDPKFSSNDEKRCYWCKREFYTRLFAFARERGVDAVFDGSNVDDEGDYRPGRVAAGEFGVVSPLVQAGFGKEDVRRALRSLGLEFWGKPPNPCLASRIPYGNAITKEKLAAVEAGEVFLAGLGFSDVRVRHHGPVARIEVSVSDIGRFAGAETRAKVVERFKSLGFVWVALDLEGYRTGSLNETLRGR
jgi:uncharacterized protein